MSIDLPIVFTVLMGAAILAYVVLDGYDLGVGMLMPAADRGGQNRMDASVGPFWDANETWLVLRTDGPLQAKAVAWARWGLLWVALGVALVSLATPLASETVREKWFDFPRTLGLMVLPLATVSFGVWVWVTLGRSDWKPFAGAVAIYVLAFIGLAYSLFPYVVMDRMTIWDAAAHPSALVFVLVGTSIVLPFIVGYTIYAYRVFRGKVKAEY